MDTNLIKKIKTKYNIDKVYKKNHKTCRGVISKYLFTLTFFVLPNFAYAITQQSTNYTAENAVIGSFGGTIGAPIGGSMSSTNFSAASSQPFPYTTPLVITTTTSSSGGSGATTALLTSLNSSSSSGSFSSNLLQYLTPSGLLAINPATSNPQANSSPQVQSVPSSQAIKTQTRDFYRGSESVQEIKLQAQDPVMSERGSIEEKNKNNSDFTNIKVKAVTNSKDRKTGSGDDVLNNTLYGGVTLLILGIALWFVFWFMKKVRSSALVGDRVLFPACKWPRSDDCWAICELEKEKNKNEK